MLNEAKCNGNLARRRMMRARHGIRWVMAAIEKGVNPWSAQAWLPTISGCVGIVYLDKALEEWKAQHPDQWQKAQEAMKASERPVYPLQPLAMDIDALLRG